jgi:hypothetical protein
MVMQLSLNCEKLATNAGGAWQASLQNNGLGYVLVLLFLMLFMISAQDKSDEQQPSDKG